MAGMTLCASGSYIKCESKMRPRELNPSSIFMLSIKNCFCNKIPKSHTRLPTKPQTHARRHSAKPQLLRLGHILGIISALSQ